MMGSKIILAIVVLLLFGFVVKGEDLSATYYNKTCPQVEKIVSDAMKSLTLKDPLLPAAILRLLFHDCIVGGCDASIFLDAKEKGNSEVDSGKNIGIRNREIISEIKSSIEAICPEQVSCSDVLVLAAREAVSISGGPTISVPLGRKDTNAVRNLPEAEAALPGSSDLIGTAIETIKNIGTTTEETIAILGAHSLGNTHCTSLQIRLEPEPFVPPGNQTKFLRTLRKICKVDERTQASTLVPIDATPRTFDNKFYQNLLNGYAVLLVDSEIAGQRFARDYVTKFANDEKAFFSSFASAFVKLSKYQVLTGKDGVVRKMCNKLN